jgi:hypothetical protein
MKNKVLQDRRKLLNGRLSFHEIAKDANDEYGFPIVAASTLENIEPHRFLSTKGDTLFYIFFLPCEKKKMV